MSKKNVWVVPNKKDGGWKVKTEGSDKAYRNTDTKKEAVDIARKVAHNNESELIVQNKDGKIGAKDSGGNDPCPPKG